MDKNKILNFIKKNIKKIKDLQKRKLHEKYYKWSQLPPMYKEAHASTPHHPFTKENLDIYRQDLGLRYMQIGEKSVSVLLVLLRKNRALIWFGQKIKRVLILWVLRYGKKLVWSVLALESIKSSHTMVNHVLPRYGNNQALQKLTHHMSSTHVLVLSSFPCVSTITCRVAAILGE